MRIILQVCAVGLVGIGAFGAIRDAILSRMPHPGLGHAAAMPVGAARMPEGAPTPPAAATVALRADRSGHFQADALVDGRPVRMLVDTGATHCAFSEEEAARAGIHVGPGDFTGPVATANGTVRVAPVRIGAIRIGGVTVRDVEAVVVPRGRLSGSLLGMSFLGRVRALSVAGGTMTLRG